MPTFQRRRPRQCYGHPGTETWPLKVDPSILPAYQWLNEAQMLAGWSDPVMRKAADTYARVYRGKAVNAPLELFKKLAVQAARELSGQQPPAKSKSKSSR